ncbi:MAG: hypothetical protein RIR51_1427, partial [Bacteroidota bacterium]
QGLVKKIDREVATKSAEISDL